MPRCRESRDLCRIDTHRDPTMGEDSSELTGRRAEWQTVLLCSKMATFDVRKRRKRIAAPLSPSFLPLLRNPTQVSRASWNTGRVLESKLYELCFVPREIQAAHVAQILIHQALNTLWDRMHVYQPPRVYTLTCPLARKTSFAKRTIRCVCVVKNLEVASNTTFWQIWDKWKISIR